MKWSLVLLAVMVAAVNAVEVDGASFQGIGYLSSNDGYSYLISVSPDGLSACGGSGGANGGYALVWQGGNISPLNDGAGGQLMGWAHDVSNTGTVVGMDYNSGLLAAYRWDSTEGRELLGSLGPGHSAAHAISSDGSAIVGFSEVITGSGPGVSYGGQEGFMWTREGGMVGLGDLEGGAFHSYAIDVSADGSVIVGKSESASGKEAFKWTADDGMVGLGDLAGGAFYSAACAVSTDVNSLKIVGYSESENGGEAFYWNEWWMTGLGDLPGGLFYSEACGISRDGSLIVGFSDAGNEHLAATNFYYVPDQEPPWELGVEAFIWDVDNGMRSLKEVLENDYGLDLTGWTLSHATDISADGRVIVGDGYNPDGNIEGWIVTIPEPASVIFAVGGLAVLLLKKKR